ncbi:MAG: hypothetical protein M1826_000515 [Phylliscum demangeonii]|nr:MAG: hypothetical protein M1826_000515 [Phylliscum demangeonii]
MSTSVYPALAADQLRQEEDRCLARELDWLLDSLQETLGSVRAGLADCASLLAADEPGSTLVLSSPRSDHVKGFVRRVGPRVVRGEMQLRMQGLAPAKGHSSFRLVLVGTGTGTGATRSPSQSQSTTSVLVLGQLLDVRRLVGQARDVVDVSSWAGDPTNASFIAGQLRLLAEHVHDACEALRGRDRDRDRGQRPTWWHDPVDASLFEPPLPDHLSFHLAVADAALALELRTLEPAPAVGAPHADRSSSSSSSSRTTAFAVPLRERLAVALGAAAPRPEHDERDRVFRYRGQDVRVKEKITVESQDPSLMAAMAKLAALEHTVAAAKKALDTVMGKDE